MTFVILTTVVITAISTAAVFAILLRAFRRKIPAPSHDAGIDLEKLLATAADRAADRISTILQHDHQMRGSWGERSLDNLLERAGMTEGRDYYRQKQIDTIDGKKKPDIILCFPDGNGGERLLPIDAKFPLPDTDADGNADPESFRRKTETAVKKLASSRYHTTPGGLGWTIMYIPSDSMYAALTERQPGGESVIEKAAAMSVLVLPPSSLLAVAELIAETGRAQNADHMTMLVDMKRFLDWDAPGMSDDVLKAVQTVKNALGKIETAAGRFEKARKRVGTTVDEADITGVRVTPEEIGYPSRETET